MNKQILTFLLLTFCLSGCGFSPFPLFMSESIETKRITSPDGLVDAILLKTNAGATTSYGYDLFIVIKGAAGEKLSLDYSKFSADKINDIRITWLENKVLQIDCKSARIFRFSNFWQSKDVQDYRYIVEIRISPTCRLNP